MRISVVSHSKSWVVGLLAAVLGLPAVASGADFYFAGRSGDAIEIDFTTKSSVPSGAVFSSLSSPLRHTTLTSDTLTGESFSSSGKFWFFPNNELANSSRGGDQNPDARGYQGTVTGSLLINGVPKTYEIAVLPGHTGSGPGSVGQSLEGLGRTNNPLFVAQQQQRVAYLGFVQEGGGTVFPNGVFTTEFDEAVRTFQGSFSTGFNTGQSSMDGIIGPITAGWLNAANAPTWEQLIDPDPQTPGSFSVGGMIGDFDILPGRDSNGQRTGLTPQFEDHAAGWTLRLVEEGSALAKAATGRTQLINALTAEDGYSSDCCHNTHRVGLDIDLHVDVSTWNFGNGVLSSEEQIVVDHALAFIAAGNNSSETARVTRIITSNQDIHDAIAAAGTGVALYRDSSTVHTHHLHIDVARPGQSPAIGALSADYNSDGGDVDVSDLLRWQTTDGGSDDLALWRAQFGEGSSPASPISAVPEPSTLLLTAAVLAKLSITRKRSR